MPLHFDASGPYDPSFRLELFQDPYHTDDLYWNGFFARVNYYFHPGNPRSASVELRHLESPSSLMIFTMHEEYTHMITSLPHRIKDAYTRKEQDDLLNLIAFAQEDVLTNFEVH